MQTIEIPAIVMAAAAEAGRQQLKALVEKERNVDGYTDNAEEMAATNAFFDSLVPEASSGDGMIRISLPDSDSPWGNTMEAGVTNPVIGGQGGMVTHPDGSKTKSEAPKQLYNTPLPWFATAAATWRENVMTQAQTLIPDAIRNAVSEYSSEIAESVKEYVAQKLAAVMGGG